MGRVFAYDLAAVNPDTGSTLCKSRLAHIFGRTNAKDYYSWGKPVRSPVPGVVIGASDDVPDREALGLVLDLVRMFTSRPELAPDDIRPFAGNHIIIEADGFNVFVAHHRSGSVRVEVGDKVNAGQALGKVGNIVCFN